MSWLPRHSVLVPVDFSDASREAVRVGLELAEAPANVHLIHVLPPLDSISPGVVWGDITDERRAESVRAFFREFARREGLPAEVTLVVRIGDPGLDVAEYASECGADLIIVSSHGYHGIRRLLMGSTAERILRHAPCPVLVLRRNDEATG
ncbi:MAG: universal stress protein [Planctomycetota bacterium]|nr:MAG: universal stress protein [Planctomycetota bacterium]